MNIIPSQEEARKGFSDDRQKRQTNINRFDQLQIFANFQKAFEKYSTESYTFQGNHENVTKYLRSSPFFIEIL